MWGLTFTLKRGDTPTEVYIPCRWISNSWVNLHSYSKKFLEAYKKQYDSATAALTDQTAARQELHRISAHRQLAALISGDDVEPRNLHDLLGWVQLKDETTTLGVKLVRFTKDPSDGAVITEADFKNSAPIGYRLGGGSGYVFDFRLGPVEWEDFDEP
jgi:hypothetical protein